MTFKTYLDDVFGIEVDYDARYIPAEGDGRNDPHYPAHWEIEINSAYQLDEREEPTGHALDLTKPLVELLMERAVDEAERLIHDNDD